LKEVINTHRPTSKAGEAIGENSVLIVKIPSNFRSGYGAVTSAEIRAITLTLLSLPSNGDIKLYAFLPGLSQFHVSYAIFISKSQLQSSESLETATVQTNVIAKTFL
jgi:hypothetical protein